MTGQQFPYNLTGSSNYAELEEAFTWTCSMILPPDSEVDSVTFRRYQKTACVVGYVKSKCLALSEINGYKCECITRQSFNLTIPAENMTKFEQNSSWRCEHTVIADYQSAYHSLIIAIDIKTVSLNPSNATLTINEGARIDVECSVNSDAVPVPAITWFLESTNISSTVEAYTTTIEITGKKADNLKTLKCKALNNKVPKTALTTLNVEYPPTVFKLDQQNIVEGTNLSVTCNATSGNPSTTTFFWTLIGHPFFSRKGSILKLSNIQKNNSGTYSCTAINVYSNGRKGNHSQGMLVNVFYPPTVNMLSTQDIVEGRNLSVTCTATPGNPSSITLYWTKNGNTGFKQYDSTLQIPNIKRNSSGTYTCTAENTYSKNQTGVNSKTMVVNVLYPPSVHTLSQQDILEGGTLSIDCEVTPGNPNSTTFYWTKIDSQGFRKNGSTLQLPNIQKNSSGVYICTAENKYNSTEKGSHRLPMIVNVLYNPIIQGKLQHIVNESERVTLSLTITSNPLANVTWYDGNKKLSTQEDIVPGNFTQKITSSFTIVSKCTDTKNFTVVTSNGLREAVTDLVELIVNCKPKPDRKNITLGVTDQSGIEFSTTVISFPEPGYNLKNENGTINIKMKDTFTRNAVNNFTIHFNQTIVDHDDYGSYSLTIYNTFGETNVIVNVIPQRKPDRPRIVEVTCEQTRTKVQWISSFNGGDRQNFTVIAFSGQYGISFTNTTSDQGENIVHMKYVENLHSSTVYVFYVSAENKHGIRSSENITCKTLGKDSSNDLPIIAGSAAAGGIALAIAIITVVILLRNYTKIDKSAKHIERLHNVNENEENEADGKCCFSLVNIHVILDHCMIIIFINLV